MSYRAISLVLLFLGCSRPEPADQPPVMEKPQSQQYDSPAKLVASMTKYRVGIISKAAKESDEAVNQRIQATSDIWKQAVVDGKLVGAVRVENPVDLWGLLFFKTESMDEMKAIASNAVLVKDGIL